MKDSTPNVLNSERYESKSIVVDGKKRFLHYTHHNNSCLQSVIRRFNEHFEYSKKWKGRFPIIDKSTMSNIRTKTMPYETAREWGWTQ